MLSKICFKKSVFVIALAGAGASNVSAFDIESGDTTASIYGFTNASASSEGHLMTRVELPLAAPSIRAGINQTILLSLLTVVVASLIGAKGLGEDVLEALQYASIGQGFLAGLAILFLAKILDRIFIGDRDGV